MFSFQALPYMVALLGNISKRNLEDQPTFEVLIKTKEITTRV